MMYKPYETTFRNQTLTIREKLANLSFTYLLLIITCLLYTSPSPRDRG